jgi:cell division protein FtsL
VAAWSEATALELPAPPKSRRKPKPRPVPSRRPQPRTRVFGGVVWIGFVTVLLTGVVALNVAVLRLNLQLDELGRERANLRAENAALASRFSSSHATARIEASARSQLGLVPAEPDDTAYVELGAKK